MKQLSLLGPLTVEQEDVDTVIRQLQGHCTACRLGLLHKKNEGLSCRGNPQAEIAVIGDSRSDKEMKMGRPMVGSRGQEWEKWARYMSLDTKTDAWTSVVCQCAPPGIPNKQSGRKEQRDPDREEIRTCFPKHTLRVLKAMPNLKVVVCIGLIAAKVILGGEPQVKTHEGQWFRTSLLPSVAVFVLPDPDKLLSEDPSKRNSGDRKGRVKELLDWFKREWLQKRGGAVDPSTDSLLMSMTEMAAVKEDPEWLM